MKTIILNKFLDKLGEPTDIKFLNEYIDFCLDHSIDKSDPRYYECHHILPQSLFSEYSNEDYNKILLLYEDHVDAHVRLTRAYPIRNFLRPLNWMLDKNIKEHKEFRKNLSQASKEWWKQFKLSDKYDTWREKRKQYAKLQMQNGHQEHMLNCAIQKHGKEWLVENARKTFTKNWEDKELREQMLSSRKKYFESEYGKQRTREIALLKWKNFSEEYRENFKEKMKTINSDETKRKDAGEKIAKKWEDTEYRKNVINSRKIADEKRRTNNLKRKNSNTMKEKWADPVWREQMLQSRKRKQTNETN